MSKYSTLPLDLSGLNTIPLATRGGKVRTCDFGAPYRPGAGMAEFLASLPKLLAADTLRAIVEGLIAARAAKKGMIWALGGHVIKCGLAPTLLDLMRRDFVTGFALNGAAAIHDLEIALAGHTSEDVAAALPDGRFGSAEETGQAIAAAARDACTWRLGLGEALGKWLISNSPPNGRLSILAEAYRQGVPVTVHVAIGTDTPHMHPALDGAALGAATHQDFKLLAALVAGISNGGAFLNVGSAVVLPEVFLKCVSAIRNLGHPLTDFMTVNMDFLQQYRPVTNVVKRPHAEAGGHGYSLTGHHELLIPLLAAALVERAE